MINFPDSPLPKVIKPIPADVNPIEVGASWLKAFWSHIGSRDIDGVLSLIRDDGFWRDTLAMTFDFRTFHGSENIKKFLQDRLEASDLKNFKLVFANIDHTCPELPWIQGLFTFAIGAVGGGNGIFRIMLDSAGEWKAYTVYTNMVSLQAYPEMIGHNRNHLPFHGNWLEHRRKEIEFEDEEPYVVVVGGGHSGLDVAARLKLLNIPTLVLEKEAAIGDNWRGRYEKLVLHDSVWFNQMPYFPFPETWPVYSPSQKLADWLAFFASSLDLNVWTSATVTSVRKDPVTNAWNVVVERGGDRKEQRILHPTHVVFAVGLMSGNSHMPDFPGQADFKGTVIHSSKHRTASDNIGKKIVIIGAGNSAHDIAADHVDHGVDVTLYQRSPIYVMSRLAAIDLLRGYSQTGPPAEICDIFANSWPRNLSKWVHQRNVQVLIEKHDKDLLLGLKKRGFKYNLGDDDSGLPYLSWTRAGGYYINMGASDMIVDGRIKLKTDSLLERFTEKGLRFEDGSELEADIVIFATGYYPVRDAIIKICGEEIDKKLKPIWGLTVEGEINSAWGDCGVENMWLSIGNLSTSRFYSKHIALQIKCIKEGLFKERYSLRD